MKKGKKQWLRVCNGMMSGALVLLGFTSCDENGTGTGRCEYGTPYAKYEIKGKVTGEYGQTVSDARILVKNMAPGDSHARAISSDTVYTKENGEYLYQNTITGYQDFRVICEDLTGTYKADSMNVKMNPTGGSGWYEGKDNKEVNFELKKKE
ncbi:radical SAM-associated putative lipoprotein [Bacteroides gallinarum]|uniref:radical SAM-associated putative lipoprotein n=1 Tax=Bacteroides gallinarum TaxID=376806 RepID=UPI00039C773E|nr:radical SAM-associated putative lipoprotein [Bacteroides gallinarum]